MGDRRMGDRRAPEKGVIRIPLKHAIIYILIAAVIIVSVATNIVLLVRLSQYEDLYDELVHEYYDDSEVADEVEETEEDGNGYDCEVSITGDKEEIKAGETITYEIKATNIEAGDGIKTFEAAIDYDKDVFDCKIETDEEGKWNKVGAIENYIAMSRADLLPSSEDQVIGYVKLTAKENAKADDEEIEFSKMKFTISDNNKNDSFELEDAEVAVKIVE